MSADDARLDPSSFLRDLSENVRQDFLLKKRVLSFEEYIHLVVANPRVHARNAAQYLVDCFQHFGRDGDRFRLFDVPFEDGQDRLVGQEAGQQDIFRILSKFAKQGKVDHLILLHGPNGSAKSTLITCIQRALEFYSSTDDGALYRFNWVFPTERIEKKGLGFGGAERPTPRSYAYLDESEVETKIQTEFKDHPLYLIPKRQRRALLEQLLAGQDFTLSETILDGDLSPMARLIFDSLLTSYNGDLERVFQHVQVERFFLSRRFRRGLVTIEPQLQVDAGLRQITLNRSLESLPKVLQNMTLFEPFGDLVDGNRGMVEFNDLLKKPIEAFKYLLATCEKSTVTLPSAILHLDTVFIASSNDRYLDAFKQIPDWPSFKGRIELVRIPYLLDYGKEADIYRSQVRPEAAGKHIAPHTFSCAGLFAVLTRLRAPAAVGLEARVRGAVERLSPIEKADLYALGRAPDWAPLEVALELLAARQALRDEAAARSPYEGEVGASPREIKAILFNAALNPDFACLSPLAVFAGLEDLLKDRSLYEFLRVDPEGDFRNPPKLVEAVRGRYLDWADDDVRQAMGLAGESQYEDLLARYALHANQVLKGEKVRNPLTGRLEEPDTKFLDDMEATLGVRDRATAFRREFMGTIGAWSLDHPGEPVPYGRLFQSYAETLRESFYKKHAGTIRRLGRLALQVLGGETPVLTTQERARIEDVLRSLRGRGYCERCAAEVLQHVLRQRYPES